MKNSAKDRLILTGEEDKASVTIREKPLSKRESGFTLVEMIVATMVMTFVFAGSFKCLGHGFSIIEKARDTRRLSQILQSELEDIRSLNWTAINAMATPATFAIQSNFSAQYGERYTCTRTIEDLKADQKKITVSASWTDYTGASHDLNYFTYITKEGLYDYYYKSF